MTIKLGRRLTRVRRLLAWSRSLDYTPAREDREHALERQATRLKAQLDRAIAELVCA